MDSLTTLTAGSESDGLILRAHWDEGADDPWIEVVHAESRALFSGELLRRVRRGEAAPLTTVDKVSIGGLIKIRAQDRTLVYRLVSHDEQRNVYTGEWPD